MKLVARGPQEEQARLELRPNITVRLGRAPTLDAGDFLAFEHLPGIETWRVPWDVRISRNHASLCMSGGRLHVERLTGATNPIFFRGEQRQAFWLEAADYFVIGDTTFHFLEDRAQVVGSESRPANVSLYTDVDLREAIDREAGARLELLAELPPIIRGTGRQRDWLSDLLRVLLRGIATAEVASLVRVKDGEAQDVEVQKWHARSSELLTFTPSRRLILKALRERHQTVSYSWSGVNGVTFEFTAFQDMDWAFCTPIGGDALEGYGLYVAGRAVTGQPDLRAEVKFAELLADLIGSVHDLQVLKERQATFGRFFSPVALPLLASRAGEEALAPRRAQLTVLFCDLRGFSGEAERSQDDLLKLLGRVSRALDVMTQTVHRYEGVLGDFQGDSALAFWGWPLARADAADQACRAAAEIRNHFEGALALDKELAGFRCGIGVASGEGVAGRLGTKSRFKIDVFGPVVNLASRLEGLTGRVGVPVLIDESTRRLINGASASVVRCRRVARLRPYGLSTPVDVSELLPPVGPKGVLADEEVELYEAALEHFTTGRWDQCMEALHRVPHWDKAKDLLLAHIIRHNRQPPSGWDGVIGFDAK